jgi:hypothetical protein
MANKAGRVWTVLIDRRARRSIRVRRLYLGHGTFRVQVRVQGKWRDL